jgi:hypothetical protein
MNHSITRFIDFCPSSGILNNSKHNILETGLFPSSGEGSEKPALMAESGETYRIRL